MKNCYLNIVIILFFQRHPIKQLLTYEYRHDQMILKTYYYLITTGHQNTS